MLFDLLTRTLARGCARSLSPRPSLSGGEHLFCCLQGYWALLLTHFQVKRESVQAHMHHELLAIEHGYTNKLQDFRRRGEQQLLDQLKGKAQ